MIRVSYEYPKDPIQDADLMFGAEFLRFVRNGEPGAVRVITEDRVDEITFVEIVCDSCNAEVKPHEPCALTPDRLYCWPCAGKWVLAQLVESQEVKFPQRSDRR